MRHLLIACQSLVIAAVAILFGAGTPVQANVPDSVYLFSYNAHSTSGLSFAWSHDGRVWRSVAGGASFVGSDFSQWGSQKKMFTPHLQQQTDGTWDLTFTLGAGIRQYAHTTSPDLILWHPQDYPMARSLDDLHQMTMAIKSLYHTVEVDGKECQGQVHHVAYSLIEQMENAKVAMRERGRVHGETLADDGARFGYLSDKLLQARVTIDASSSKEISDKLIGIFFEDINYSADGGLYAELIENRDFEYGPADRARYDHWDARHSWRVDGTGMTFDIDTIAPLNDRQTHYARLEVQAVGGALVNEGFDGIVLRRGEKYDVSLFARQLSGQKGKLRLQLMGDDGRPIGETTLSAPHADWRQLKGVITATADATHGTLAIAPTATGTLAIDFVSLFPQATFKGRKNGMRADLAQTLADLHPRFMRFPGGCLVHGDGLGNIYHWKETIGPLHERKGLRNIWGYHQSRGLGYYEFFQFCEDLGCEPLPVVAAAVPCQNSAYDAVLGGGQQGGIPFGPQFEQYKQDILDLIEWANGDPKQSQWARMRAEAGHPKPFGLKYIGIGNEDLISDTFAVRYLQLIDAVRQRYPDIVICGTVGPFFEGSDYEQGWRLAKDHHIPMVDEHYYVAPGWYINNQDYYDAYDRNASKVYLGEYASHGRGRRSTIETALTCAMHICNLERNGDVVAMSSYAPLLAKNGRTQWTPDLIYFDNTQVFPTVDYYVQLLCGQSQGNRYLPTAITATQGAASTTGNSSATDVRPLEADAARRLAVSTVRDMSTGRTYIKLVNLLPQPLQTQLDPRGITLPAKAVCRQLTGAWDDTEARPSAPADIDLTAPITLPPYSFTIIEF